MKYKLRMFFPLLASVCAGAREVSCVMSKSCWCKEVLDEPVIRASMSQVYLIISLGLKKQK